MAADMPLVKKGLPWLKRLQGALDDDDSSDSSSQPTIIAPKKVASKKPEKEKEEARRRPNKKRRRRQEDDSADSSSEGSVNPKERRHGRLKKSAKLRHRRLINEGPRDSKTEEPPVGSAKSRTASLKGQRVQKLRALRVTSGEQDKMAAIKLIRRGEQKEEGRNRTRETRGAQNISVGVETDIQDGGEPRRRPQSPSEAGRDAKGKNSTERKLHKASTSRKEGSKSKQSNRATLAVEKTSDLVKAGGDDESEVETSAMAKVIEPDPGKRDDDNKGGLGTSLGPVTSGGKEGESSVVVITTASEPVNPEENAGGSSGTIRAGLSEVKTTEINSKAEGKAPEGAKTEHTSQEELKGEGATNVPASSSNGMSVVSSKPDSNEQVTTESLILADGTADLVENEDSKDRFKESSVTTGPSLRTEEETKSGKEEKEKLLLDVLPIPRKVPKEGESTAHGPSTGSFVIPKRKFVKTGITGIKASAHVEPSTAEARESGAKRSSEAPLSITMLPLPSPEPSPNLPIAKCTRPERKRTKNSVPVKSALLTTQDQALMRLSRKRNSIMMAAAELAAQAPDITSRKGPVTRMMGYEVYDVDGKTLPDLFPRLSCAKKHEMASDRESYAASFFGVSRLAPKASSAIEECGDNDPETRKINCYEELRFERPEDREFYQRKMYGTTFVPQHLRGWITLIVRNAQFQRKSTGIRFNQDRDRDEFAAKMSKRYTFNKSVPRCDIPRENWQKLMRNQPGIVYLHYYNREDAERASHIFRDDFGQPLQIRLELKAGAKLNAGSSLNPVSSLQRTPRRSCSNERSAPEPSPLLSQNGSACNSPSWRQERQPASKSDRYSIYNRSAPPPPAPWSREEGRYRSSISGIKRARALLERKSRSRSRSKSFHDKHYSSGQESRAGPGTIDRYNTKPPAPDKGSRISGGNKNDSNGDQTDVGTPAQKRTRTFPYTPRRSPTSARGRSLREETNKGGLSGHKIGEIKTCSAVTTSSPVGTSSGGDNKRELERTKASSRRWQQEPHYVNAHIRRDSFSDNLRDRSTGPTMLYRSSQQQLNRDSSKQTFQSRPRPKPSSPASGGHGDGRNDRYRNRRGPREFGRSGANDNAGEHRMHSDRGRGAYNNYGGGASTRPRT